MTVRFYPRFLFVFLLGAIVIFGSVFLHASYVVHYFIKQSETDKYKTLLTLYETQIFPHYPNLLSVSPSTMSLHPRFSLFRMDTEEFFRGLPILKVHLFSGQGDEIMRISNSDLVPNTDAKEAGKIVASLQPKEVYAKGKGNLLHIFIPVGAGVEKFPIFFAEVIVDISDIKAQSSVMHITLSGILVVIIGLLALGLVLLSKRLGSIIHQHQFTNIALSAAKDLAESQNREKSNFMASISHELRTPLNAIIGFSKIIQDETLGPINNEKYKDYISDIHDSGTHLLNLINDILDYSKAESNELVLHTQETDVTKQVEICYRLLRPKAEELKVVLKKELQEQHIIALVDQKRFKQIIFNLLSNAIKFSEEGGEILLSLQQKGTVLELIIKDEGIGIAAKDMDKALNGVGQLDSSLSRRYEGTGLGLPLTKKLIELMDGTLLLESKLGEGTKVTVTFPIIE